MTTTTDRWRSWGLRRWAQVRRTSVGRLLEDCALALARIELFDRAMTLAAQAFTSIVPIMLVTATLHPRDGGSLGSALAESLDLPQSVRSTLQASIPSDATVESGIGVFGVVVAIVSATSFSRALERIYLRIWQVPRPSLRSWWRWFAALIAILLAVGLIGLTRRASRGEVWSGWLPLLVQLVLWTAVWTFAPWVLVQREVRWRPLLFSGVATSVCLAGLTLAGSVYLPIVLVRGAREFGVLGLVFSYISWLFAIAFVVIGVAVIARACAQDPGPLGRWVRGRGHASVFSDPETVAEPDRRR
ncbi:YhjD/YihY/BrkB family envelope integrity protein [Cellulomonas alba]|uniref:YhjD/YihY/BrkB family envelope integrity protein n=1 Tax=Cellulomonas alba TaxID=3053467 RepID=A0ABT7SGD2_9CELL|nr:YhjD/YihY/BrkB family envelope integrity protein [Cellulomonas alba]MDM7855236.1 YhjD/YihY/BrkB family envelope integrity protein [Cellulomonas alba]